MRFWTVPVRFPGGFRTRRFPDGPRAALDGTPMISGWFLDGPRELSGGPLDESSSVGDLRAVPVRFPNIPRMVSGGSGHLQDGFETCLK